MITKLTDEQVKRLKELALKEQQALQFLGQTACELKRVEKKFNVFHQQAEACQAETQTAVKEIALACGLDADKLQDLNVDLDRGVIERRGARLPAEGSVAPPAAVASKNRKR